MIAHEAPAVGARTEVPGRGAGVMMAVVRIALGVMWVANVSWKTPPDFGESDRAGLYQFTSYAVEYPVVGVWSWIVKELVLANFTFFGWMTLVVESALGAFLLLGLGTRLWALVGIVMSITIGLSVAKAPEEWPWSYYLMALAHLAVLATAAGRTWGLDGVIRPLVAGRTSGPVRWYRRAS